MAMRLNCVNGGKHTWMDTGIRWSIWSSNNTNAHDMPPSNLFEKKCLICGITEFAPYTVTTTAEQA